MLLGFVSAILPEESFEKVIDFASDNSFKCVEIMCWPSGGAERRYAGVTHIDVDKLTGYNVEKIKDYTKKRNVEISALGYYPNFLDPDSEKRRICINHLKKVIKGAAMLGIKNVTTFIGRDPKKTVKDNMYDFKKIWPDIIKYAEESIVRVLIENCPMFFTYDEWPGGKNVATTPQIWQEMFSIIDSDFFGLNYDPSHFLWQHMDYIKPIYEFRGKLFHIHLKDAKIYKEKLDRVGITAPPLEFHSPKIPGLGDIDWSKFISALTDIRYDSFAVIEVEDKAFEDSLEDRYRALLQSKAYISQYLV